MSTAVAAIYGNGERVDLSAARAKLASTQEELCRLRVDRERGALLPAAEVESAWQGAIGRSRALLLGIPTSAAGRIVLLARQHEDAKAAERAVRELLTGLVDAAVNELRNVISDDDAAELEEVL